mgnify:CR=1 FL=1
MNEQVKPVPLEETDALLKEVEFVHYVFFGQSMHSLAGSTDLYFEPHLHVSVNVLEHEQKKLLKKITIKSLSEQTIPIKLITGTFVSESKNNYVFISPTHDAIFLLNEKNLYLTSGMVKGEPLSQYGVLPPENLKQLHDGMIPLCPLGKGNVGAVFSLETVLAPYETVDAYTWILKTNTQIEEKLLQKNQDMKYRLAFSEKK